MSRLNLQWRYWTRIPRWSAEPRLFWIFAGAILAASLVGDWIGFAAHGGREDRIRYAGYLLEVFGLVSVAIGLSRKLDLFHGKSVWRLFVETTHAWLCRFPLLRQDRRLSAGTGEISISSPNIELYAQVKIDPSKPDREKLEWLLAQYYNMCDVVQQAQQDIRANKRECDRQLKDLRAALEETIGKVETQAARAHVGEIGGEFVGLGSILCGVTFATVPEAVHACFWWLIGAFEWIGEEIGNAVAYATGIITA